MRIIGIDPGSEISGVAMIGAECEILHASNPSNSDVLALLRTLIGNEPVILALEALVPYASRLTPHTLSTAEWIGELKFRIKLEGLNVAEMHLIPRNSVKYWVFNTCPEICIPRIDKRIAAADRREVAKGKKGRRKLDGELKAATFHWVDDRIIICCLKHLLNIPTPRPGKSNIYGLVEHSWQALAAAVYCSRNISAAMP